MPWKPAPARGAFRLSKMAIITLNSARKAFGAFQALDDVTFTIGAGEKLALVGPNGSGKTTILRLILGLEEPDSGVVEVLPGAVTGYMPQDSELTGDGLLLDEVSNASGEVRRLEGEIRSLEHAISAASPDEDDLDSLLERLGEAQMDYERLGGYSFDAEVKATLTGLGLGPEHWDTPVNRLSGGQKTRAALAKLLLQQPDVLLLDEPTNHLDLEACEWLEEFLQGFSGAVLVVSHDRYFLDQVVTKVVDLHGGCTRVYAGDFTAYAHQKAGYVRQQEEAYERQQEEIDKLQDFILRYKAGQRARQAHGREKMLARMERLQRPDSSPARMRLALKAGALSGQVVMVLDGVAKAFGGRELFRGLDLTISKGDRVGIVGPNGSGKTTLLRMMLGQESASAGIIELGHGVEVGYFAQDLGGLEDGNTVLDELLDCADLTAGEARSMLARFLFRGDDVFKQVGDLSGGERNRLVLAKLMVTRPNVLVLDEPTNHLDIDSREALGEALQTFDGTIILTSHDRYLLKGIANRIVEVANGRVKVFDGNYSLFAERARTQRVKPGRRKAKPKPDTRTRPGQPKKRKGPPVAQLEKQIEEAEARSAELNELLTDPELYADHVRAAEVMEEHQAVTARIEALYSQWEEASAE